MARRSAVTGALLVALIGLVLASSTHAQQLYWDPNGSTPGAGGTPNGIWDLSTKNWNGSADGTGNPLRAWQAGDIAVFSAGSDAVNPYTVTIAGSTTISVGGLIFEDGSATINGANSESILSFAPNSTLTAVSGTHTINATIDSQYTLGKQGAGTVMLGGNNSFAGLYIFDGKIGVSSDANLGPVSSQTYLYGGTLLVTDSFSTSRTFATVNSGTFEIAGAGTTLTLTSGLVGSSAPLFKTGSGTLELGAAGSRTAPTTIEEGTIRLTHANALGGTFGEITVNAGTLEIVNLNLTSPVTLNNGATFRATGISSYRDTGSPVIGDGAQVDIMTAAAGDLFVFNSEFRNGSAASNITFGGPGTIVLARGTTGTAAYQGGFTLADGTLRVTDRTALATPGLAEGRSLTLTGGTLDLRTDLASDFRSNTTVTGDATILSSRFNEGAAVTHSLGTLGIDNSQLTIAAGDQVTGGTQGLNFTSATLSGNTVLNIVNGLASTTNVTIGGISDGSSSGSLTKSGNGTLTLIGGGSFTGTTTINGGVVSVQHSSALGTTSSGTTVNDGGELQLQGGVAVGSELLTLNGTGVSGNGALRNMSGNNSWAGNIILASSSLIQTVFGQLTLSGILSNGGNGADFYFDGGGNTFVLGPITGNADVVKNGTGTLTLQGANTYTGGTFVNGGTFLLTGSLNGMAGTALTFGGDSTFNFNAAPGTAQGMGTLTFGAGDGTVESTYGGSGNTSLTFSSLGPRGPGATGNFVITGGTNGTTNKIVLTGQPSGFIDTATFFNGDDYAYVDPSGYVRAINYGVDPGTAVSNGGVSLSGDHVKANGHINSQGTQRFETLHISSNIQYTLGNSQKVTVNGILKTGNVPGGATISGGSYLEADPNAEMTIRTSRENDFLTIMTPIVANGNNAVTKTGAGTLTLSGANTYTGGTYVNDGTLKIGASERLLNSGSITVAGGTFDVQNFTETVGTVTLSSGGISGSGTGTVIGTSYDVRSGSVSAILAGPASLAKSTEGTVTLTGANTYTGTTTVNDGQLVAAAPSGSALGSTSAVTVNADGTLTLGASNQLNDAAPVTLGGGTLSTGGFSEGTESSAGAGALNLTAAGSTIDFGTGDTGTLAFAIFNPGSNFLTIANWTGTPGAIGDGTTDQLLFAADPTPYLGSFNFSGYEPGGLALLLPSGFYEVTPDFTPVPEMNPTVAAALVCLFGLLAMKRSRRELGHLLFRRHSSFFARR